MNESVNESVLESDATIGSEGFANAISTYLSKICLLSFVYSYKTCQNPLARTVRVSILIVSIKV